MKKIMIQESNNQLINSQAQSFILPNEDEWNELRTYILQHADFSGLTDFDLFLEVMKWVNDRWTHDGMNDAGDASSLEILRRAEDGESFRCVEYSKVTKDILLAMGYIARSLSVLSENADYAGFGQAHSVTEVWSNRYEKWIFIDPQFNVYAIKDDIPLSYYEISAAFEDVSFRFLSNEPFINEYRDFIGQYFGYVGSKMLINGLKTDIFLQLKGKRQLMTFQAMQFSNSLFTERAEDLYFNPNNTAVLFEYTEPVDPLGIMKENNLNTAEEMMNHFDLFSVKPNLILRFISNTPYLSHYELAINENEPVEIKNGAYEWSIKNEVNLIRVCSVNKLGIKGSLTEIKITYK